MNRINLLKPDVVNGFLEGGKGQEVTYLNIDPELSPDKLDEDIANGATYLSEVRELMNKKVSRVVAIKCRSREEGLLGVSYLASYYNMKDGADASEVDCDENIVAEVRTKSPFEMTEKDIAEDMDRAGDFEFTDQYTPIDGLTDDWEPSAESDDEDEDDWEDGAIWEETPWKIPIVDMGAISVDIADCNNPFYSGNYGFDRRTDNRNQTPYWKYTRRESICIEFNAQGGTLGLGGFNNDVFKRFKNNKHLYVLVIDTAAEFNEQLRRDSIDDYDDEDDYYNPFICCGDWYEANLTGFVLEEAAEIISIHHGEDKLEKYYQNLFENWVGFYRFSLDKGFPVAEISKKIVDMDNPSKSDLIDKVVSYVIKDFDEPAELTETDFNVLYKLHGLGFKRKIDEKEHKSLNKMEKNLVGMEDIKDQITSIVETFRFMKKRKAAGLQGGGYHNVHMMLGAPGTAKTTVAQLLGEIMAEEKLLKSNRFVSVNGAELKGMYVGHSAPKVKSLFEKNDIIFIDEAYAVAAGRDGESDSFSQEAIAQLIVELEKHGLDRLVIFAGYGGPRVSAKDNRMQDFVNANPGIRSRINSTIYFESYDADQMVEIFKGQARINQYIVPKAADKYVHAFFEKRVSAPDFGNGREARSLLENAMVQAARRIASVPDKDLTRKQLQQITVNDIRLAIEKMKNATVTQKGTCRKLGFGA